jgi:hypothetical protein
MQWSELLDELRSGILRDSSSLKTGDPDHYWDDIRLARYLDDAHKRFARLSLCIHDDTTPEVTEVELEDGVPIYQLHNSVLSVLSAKHQDDQQDLVRVAHDVGQTLSNPYTEDFDFALLPAAGKPRSFSTDEGLDPTQNHSIRMRFFGVPDVSQDGKIVNLRTIRVPIVKVTVNNLDDEPEIPEPYQIDLCEWAAWRALRNWDIDSEDRSKADQHKTRFQDAVLECRRDVLRKTFPALRWQFGQAAWSGYVKN